MSRHGGLRGYLLVTLCYQAFTLSDGAMRMLVLLHLHDQGRTAWALALVLVPYEVAGVLTNLLGGYLGARFGLKPTLVAGLLLQTVACALLATDPSHLTLGYVMATQVLSGVAKDLAKTSAKSYVKALSPPGGAAGLFRWVAWMTGSKNTVKGLGFFVGGALLAWAGFRHTNVGLAALLATFAALALATLPRVAGRRTASLRGVLRQDRLMWWLGTARMFLFGSRDAWFAVALPLFLVQAGWSHPGVGAFLAAWVIVYGLVQASAPRLTRVDDPGAGVAATRSWTAALLLPLLPTALLLPRVDEAAWLLPLALVVYGALFAVTSSLHSWLVIALHDDDRNPERVGFYYAANAAGRLAGTLASGARFGAAATAADGLTACLFASCAAIAAATCCTVGLRAALARRG
ncbi:MAG: organoarsenical effux MFS transporter ArsJ [Planctomycetes bacterium]|nr:organoarsenical effux MFS transporter ArsJ [Planctomycetota bacterium]